MSSKNKTFLLHYLSEELTPYSQGIHIFFHKLNLTYLSYSHLNSYMINTTEKSYSIAHTKNHLPVLVHSLESNPSIPITRRGKIVAYLVSTKEYEALKGKRRKFTDSWKTLRASDEFKKFTLSDKEVSSWRDSSTGRDSSL